MVTVNYRLISVFNHSHVTLTSQIQAAGTCVSILKPLPVENFRCPHGFVQL